ncbi:MAG: SPOR domain-containing protein [Myxococcota bacterium]|nr:SPOR domain-containing protein [Myxococcota bacterium]
MNIDPGGFRNIDQIEERDDDRRTPRGVTVAFVVLGGACVVFAALALEGRTSKPPDKKTDPLGDLLAQGSHGARVPPTAGAPAATDLLPREVTFPQMLSDNDHPSTALAAVRPGSSASAAPAPTATQPPPPTDRLSVVPLPAQNVLEATPIVTRPRDAMTKAASDAAKMDSSPPSKDSAPAGHEGGYQLQVSSFHTQAEAQSFADQLRARGHKAYVVEASVPGRGTWYRVRVGPFATQHAVAQYRAEFEEKEHVVPFIVTPETTAKAH